MQITYKDAKSILAQYANRGGLCPANEEVDLFVRQVLEYILISGEYGNLRKFTFMAYKGCFTVPFELEIPLKIKIDNHVGSAWSKWFEFHTTKELGPGCIPCDKAISEEPNYFPTVYDLPACGSRVGVFGSCDESPDASVIVQGVDVSGREVYSLNGAEKIAGEKLSIQKGKIKYSETLFARIDHVIKSPTNGYIQLLSVNPDSTQSSGFLSEYSPVEERPAYRRFRITSNTCSSFMKVEILGRIRLKSHYMENDLIPFETIYTLHLAAQAVNANYNNQPDVAKAKDGMMQDIISRQNEYKRVNVGQPLEVYVGTSAGKIVNIV